MKRVNQYEFYQLGTILQPLTNAVQGGNLQAAAYQYLNAKIWLTYILGNQTPVKLVVSRQAAQKLLDSLRTLLPDVSGSEYILPTIDPTRTLTWSEAYSVSNGLQEFQTVFAAELPTIATYIVLRKGIYDTADLTERAEQAIDDDVRGMLPATALKDFRQAGRCLAFELATASGFHTTRATEAVLRQYWMLVKNPPMGTKPPDMATCINELRAAKEDPKLMDILDHIKDLHRNALMHPEEFLAMTQALRLFDIAKSAISAMGIGSRALHHPLLRLHRFFLRVLCLRRYWERRPYLRRTPLESTLSAKYLVSSAECILLSP